MTVKTKTNLRSSLSDQLSGYIFGNPETIVKVARLIFLCVILLFILIIQGLQTSFINPNVIVPIYGLLTLAFLSNSLYLLHFERFVNSLQLNVFIFALDSLVITGLLYLTQATAGVFSIFYLINIVLCGALYQTKGARYLAMWTSTLFSLLLIFTPEIQGYKLYLTVILNNIAFFGVAAMSGLAAEQILQMGKALERGRKDIKALRNLNERIIENISSGLIYADESLSISQWNRAAERLLSRTHLEGLSLKEVFLSHFKELEKALQEENNTRVEMFILNQEGGKMTLEINTSRILGEDKEPIGYILLLQDLTQLKEIQRQKQQQEKLAAVGQLAAGIAHEIRNPLASISGSIQLMAMSLSPTDEDSKKLMNISLKEIDRLNGLISEFLEYVKPEESPKALIDLNALMSEVLSLIDLNKTLSQDIQKNIQLEAKSEIWGNALKLKQAFLNIVMNACQAFAEGAPEKKLSILAYNENQKVIVKISDNGVGISDEFLEKIFEPFYTSKPKGTGLGLAITHKVLQAHSAEVYVESQKGKGTTFTLCFPASNILHGNEARLKVVS